MNRIDRLQAILIQLQSKKIIKAKEIADRFDISLRTVYRDIRALEKGGVPIGAEAGIGYFLPDNYNLPPIMFNTNEALSMLLAGKIMPHFSDKETSNAFESALTKVKAILNIEHKNMVAELESNIVVHAIPTKKDEFNTIHLQEVQWALIHKKVIKMDYYSPYSQESSTREIEPITLIYYAANWHIIAFCRLRKSYRDFRLDRISNLVLEDECYERNLGIDFEQYLKREKEKMPMHSIKIFLDKRIVPFVAESKHWYGYLSEKECENSVEMEFVYPNIEAFTRWLIALGKGVHIEKPEELIAIRKKFVEDLVASYL